MLSATSLAWAQGYYNPYAPTQPYPPPPQTNPYAPPQQQQYTYVAAQPVSVNFRARADDRYRVSVDDQSCTTPCEIKLRPGAFVMQVESDRHRVRMDLDVSRATTIDLWTSSRTGYIVGGALMGVGVLSLGVGGYFIDAAPFANHEAVGAVNVVLGCAAIAVGIAELALAGKIRARGGE